MTSREAIEYIKKTCYGDWCKDVWREAMDAAVSALHAQETKTCDTCIHNNKAWDDDPCDGCCANHSGYEPSDLISRQTAIEALKICDTNWDGLHYNSKCCEKCPISKQGVTWYDEDRRCYCWEILLRESAKLLQASAQPEPQWIPVGERLPEDWVPVLVTLKKRELLPAWIKAKPENYFHFVDADVCENGEWTVNKKNVTAWMPLPEPYQEVKDD